MYNEVMNEKDEHEAEAEYENGNELSLRIASHPHHSLSPTLPSPLPSHCVLPVDV